MKEAIVSRAYAQSIYELGKEQSINTADELTKLNEVINHSNDLENVLFIDVFSIEEKMSVLSEVMKRLELSPLTINFMNFLLSEKRIGLMPLIYKDIMVLDDHDKGFIRGVIEGMEDQVDPDFLNNIKTFLKNKLGKDAVLEYSKSEKITAGYKVTVEDLQLDASLDNQLSHLRNEILNS